MKLLKNIIIFIFISSLVIFSNSILLEEDKEEEEKEKEKKAHPQNITIYSKDELTYFTTWATSQVLINSNGKPPIPLTNNSLRQIIHTSLGGELIRIKFSNIFGKENLEIKSVSFADSAKQSKGAILLDTLVKLSFGGEDGIIIPPGGESYCDTFSYPLSAHTDYAISIYFGKTPSNITGHFSSKETSFLEEGDKIEEEVINLKQTNHWYIISELEISEDPPKKTVVCFGDSITDGSGSTDNKNNRWSDVLSERLTSNKETKNIAVINEGIGATHVTTDALERLERDVIMQKGVKYIVMLYGVNDLIHNDEEVEVIINAYQKIIETAHKNNIFIYAGTIVPFGKSSYYTESREEKRKIINKWIRDTPPEKGGFDSFIDFDDVTKDPQDDKSMDSDCESNDGLHPGPNGYKIMAEIIDLKLFTKEPNFKK